MATVDFDDLAAAVTAGVPLGASQLADLGQTRDLIRLGMLASDARARLHGTRGTFVRVETLDFATITPGVARPGVVAGLVRRAADSRTSPAATTHEGLPDAGEVRLVGAPVTLDAACAAVLTIAQLTETPISGFSLDDVRALGTPVREAAAALKAAGLCGIATARIDRLSAADLEALAAADLPLLTVTLGTLLDGDALLAALQLLRAWQAATGIIRGCSPLAVETSAEQPSTGYDDMRSVAIARVVLDNIPHVQAHWTRMGAKLAQACLLFGANDVDAVPARDDKPHGPRRAIVEEVRRNITAAALDPVERDGLFAPIARRTRPAPTPGSEADA